MNPHLYLALLRGINVGGKSIIKMATLKDCFEGMGFGNVATYIQSGNVLFESAEKNREKLEEKIEKALSKEFSVKSRVVVLSHGQLVDTVKRAPKGFGTEPAKYRYDVIFLKPPVTAREAVKQVSAKEGVDQVWVGAHVLYFSRFIAKAAQSHLSRIIQKPVYKSMTIRNWNTTTKLLAMMGKGSNDASS